MVSKLLNDARSIVESYAKMEMFHNENILEPISIEWALFKISNTFVERGTLLDLGGGISFVNAVLVKLGMKVHCVDLMESYFIHSSLSSPMTKQLKFLEKEGVIFINADLIEFDAEREFGTSSLDVVCSYHCLEHLHHSPRTVLSSAMAALKKNGIIFIEVPNAVNILKRIKVVLGKTNYLPYKLYYESDKYVLHIREYTTGDLEALAHYLGLKKWKIVGSNYYGNLWNMFGVNYFTKFADFLLKLRPGLCGAIHLKGINPH